MNSQVTSESSGTEQLRARISWARIAEPQDTIARGLIARLGFEEALARVRADQSPGVGARFAARLRQLDFDRELAMAAKASAQIVVPGDVDWPSGVDDLEHPPWVLWVKGKASLAHVSRRSVAIVGARASTHYGDREAASIAAGLSDQGFAVVSGAAYGIDAAAHRGALAAGGLTVAFLACGVDRAYPARHSDLLEQIGEQGGVVSEVPPGSPPLRTRFLARNRLIAAASSGTVLVEAGLRSGARSTVSVAVALNRPVGALPGPVTSMVSAGCHEEIRAGRAQLITDAAEAADLCGDIGKDMAAYKSGPVRGHDHLDALEMRVWECLRPKGRPGLGVEEISALAGLSALETVSALGHLQTGHSVVRQGHLWLRA